MSCEMAGYTLTKVYWSGRLNHAIVIDMMLPFHEEVFSFDVVIWMDGERIHPRTRKICNYCVSKKPSEVRLLMNQGRSEIGIKFRTRAGNSGIYKVYR